MIQLLPCSNCQRTFSLRKDVSDQALLRCPNCGNQFRVGDLLDALYSPWQIVEDPGMASISEAATESSIDTNAESQMSSHVVESVDDSYAAELPSELMELDSHETSSSEQAEALTDTGDGIHTDPDAPDELVVVEEYDEPGLSLDNDESTPGIDNDPQGHVNVSTWEQVSEPLGSQEASSLTDSGVGALGTKGDTKSTPSRDRVRRKSKSESGGLGFFLQVMAGGFGAIPVTLLLLWWVVGKDLGNIGQTVAQYVPWIVPEKLRTPEYREPRFSGGPRGTPPARGESGFRNFDDVMPAETNSSQPSTTEANSENNDATKPVDASVASATKDIPTNELPIDKKPEPAASMPTSPISQIISTLSGAKEKIGGWKKEPAEGAADATTKPDDVKKSRVIALLDDLSSVGDRMASMIENPQGTKLVRNELREVGRQIVADADLEDWFKKVVRAQFNGLPRPNQGRVMLCSLGEVQEVGEEWLVKPADDSLKQLALPRIVVPKSVVSNLESGQRVLIVGRLENSADAAAPKSQDFRATFLFGL